MSIKQLEDGFRKGLLTKKEVVAILTRENGWNYSDAKNAADYYERMFQKN